MIGWGFLCFLGWVLWGFVGFIPHLSRVHPAGNSDKTWVGSFRGDQKEKPNRGAKTSVIWGIWARLFGLRLR
ncbi:Hypothetical protein [Corynebacterium glutamicum ATCC 13032]|uniref:Uncharacterized protein n=1 Tax=Corynebacterium glutamicum (strain ATCC 13032 / DSM 20300 / JCM 1318 / BCRC 11384 / CCUG 27702 / LMG 3730 / NBRC 12168 / NCIMB 10025 / NRRL B-2784 / 534) TaxID=196627 RepID=Q8NNZ1_CORGL|nr:Hypothetical protein [Corynebacterium glutamicum ATCC 13032]